MSKKHMLLADKLLCLIFPRRCAICDCVIDSDKYLCDECSNIPMKTDGFCPSCSLKRLECSCHPGDQLFDDFSAPLFYKGEAVNSYFTFKFRGRRDKCDYFVSELLRVFYRDFGDVDFDCICYVPGSHSKQENGGYIPAKLLARGVSKHTGIPIKKNALKKVRENQIQHDMTRAARRENVRDVYRAEPVENKTILLIDDIKTTGATLDECTKELKLSGADYVCALTVFTSLHRSMNSVENTDNSGYN